MRLRAACVSPREESSFAAASTLPIVKIYYKEPRMAQLTRQMLDGLPKNGPTDPIEFYRRPLVGRLFRERINMGLRMLERPGYERALEIGYGAGAVLLALAPSVKELHGLDLDAVPEPVNALLAQRGWAANLVRGSVYDLPYADGSFDLVVCFSVFEHLHQFEKGLAQVARVLRPSAQFLLGMPAVNLMMEAGFRAIGFKGIEDHHVTTPQAVSKHFGDVGLRVARKETLDFPLPGVRLYYTWLLEKAPV
jgi:SAM-dependent methyltransferase